MEKISTLSVMAFSGSQNAENLHTRSMVSLKPGFYDWAKSHFQASKMKTTALYARYLERWIRESAEIAFTDLQKGENIPTRT